MKFDFVIGNPPYQDETLGENEAYAPPIYHLFIEESYKVGETVMLIHPARFLFNAGNTPKAWNEKMLSDKHLKVIYYEHDSAAVFPNTYITGGIAITYHNENKDFGAIEVFTSFPALNSILSKVRPASECDSIVSIIYNQTRFDLEALYADHPEMKAIIGSDGKDRRFRNNIFDKIPLFTEEKTNDDDILVIGVQNSKRVWRYFRGQYVETGTDNLWGYKAIISSANGASGTIGQEAARITTVPFLGKPGEGHTQTFISFGDFRTENEANACVCYLKTRFARLMLAILKVTQDNKRNTWRYVPLQDFTPSSDIDWSQPIAAIDRQLYLKYGLSEDEIAFIESHVKEMS